MTEYGQRLRDLTTGSRLHLTQFGTRKALDPEQVAEVAGQFNADERRLSASKRLIDSKHKSWKGVKNVLQAAKSYWLCTSVPFVEPGIRLMRRQRVEEFTAHIDQLRGELDICIGELDGARDDLIERAKQELGTLFNEADFPTSFKNRFAIEVDFQNIEPPSYLQQLAPEVYERECQRVKAAFDQAVILAEQGFAQEMLDIVTRLQEKLEPGPEGARRRLHESVVDGLRDFAERFKSLSVGSNAQLEELVSRCEGLMEGVDAKNLRNSGELRHQLLGPLTEVRETLASLVVKGPERRLRVRMESQDEPQPEGEAA